MRKVFLILGFVILSGPALATTAEEYYNAGLVLYKQGEFEKSIQYFRAALSVKNDYWEAYQFMGQSYYQLSNRTEALASMRESLKIHPANPDLRKVADRIASSSPWVAEGGWTARLSVFAIILSLFTLTWTTALSMGYKPKWLKSSLKEPKSSI